MSIDAFPAPVSAALDRFTVPALPAGFADRLVERALLRAEIAAPMPSAPRRRASPWVRAGRITATLGAIGLFTAAAAAGGLLGNKVYVPGITEVMEHARIIEPRHTVDHRHAVPVAKAAPQAAIVAQPLAGQAKAKAKLDQLRADPAFNALPPRRKLQTAIRETRTMVQAGEITKQEGRAALKQAARENYDSMTPEEQQAARERLEKWQQKRKLRREIRQERLHGQRLAPENPEI